MIILGGNVGPYVEKSPHVFSVDRRRTVGLGFYKAFLPNTTVDEVKLDVGSL